MRWKVNPVKIASLLTNLEYSMSKHSATTQHPASLRVFFATEMWERYGFYVVQTLLVLYLALHYNWPDKRVYPLVGSFTALTYLSPVIGGWVADHLLGQKKAVLLGAVILFLAYIVLTCTSHEEHLIMALAAVAVGTGLLKPNISSLLGNQYPADSAKREAGFTIFYMGLTTGIILGTTLPSMLNQYFGWSVSFGSAAVGMVIAFSVFWLGVKRYAIADYHVMHVEAKDWIKSAVLISGLWGVGYVILNSSNLADMVIFAVVIASVVYLVYTVRHEPPLQANQTIIIGLLCLISVMFWAFYFEMFLCLTLFIARVVKPTLLGIAFPPPYYVAVQSIGMLVFGFFLSRRNPKPIVAHHCLDTNRKFLIAMGLMCCSYALITLVSSVSTSEEAISPWLVLPAYIFISLAELLLSPVGLAAITTLACRQKVSTMMGIFFVSLGIGAYLSGKLANITAVSDTQLSISALKIHYSHGFTTLLIILLAGTVIAFLLNRLIKKLLIQAQSYV